MEKTRNDFLSILSLFTSVSTLLCCALPALLVVIGLGAAVAGILSDFPLLISLSKNKIWVFTFSFLIIGLNFYLVYRKKEVPESCEYVLGQKEAACDVASRWSKVFLWVSFSLLLIGFFVSYLMLPIIKFLE